jgi:predicted nucleotidyltransferase
MASGHFEQRGKAAHRLHYRAPGTAEQMWLDVVPFGGVQDEGGEIAWPPDQSVRMNVAGFAQTLDAAVPVRFAADLVVPVASLPSQAMPKIIAWQDRHATDRKDAIDLLFLLASYSDAGNLDRLYGDAFDLVEKHDYDPDTAGAALLGRDMAGVATSGVCDQILSVLAPDDPSPRILEHMLGYRARIFEGDSPVTIERLFNAFRTGFLDGIQRAGRP